MKLHIAIRFTNGYVDHMEHDFSEGKALIYGKVVQQGEGNEIKVCNIEQFTIEA